MFQLGNFDWTMCFVFQRHYNQLKEELAKMRPPKELEDEINLQDIQTTTSLEQPLAASCLDNEAAEGASDLPLLDSPASSNPPPLLAAAEAGKPWFPPEKMPPQVKHVLNGPKSAPPGVGAVENDLDEKDHSSSSESTNTDQSMTSSTEDYHPNIKC